MNAAEMAEQSYDIAKMLQRGRTFSEVKAHLDTKGAQAQMMAHGVMIIPGSNELMDWFTNFDVYQILGRRFGRRDKARGRTGATLHAGFLCHANKLHGFAQQNGARFIIGHSLGAATAQILGTSLGLPAIGFASPRVKFGTGKLKNERKVLNICRADDLVTRVPPSEAGFRRLGKTVRLVPGATNPGMDHSMGHYIASLKEHVSANGLPKHWGG
ncbi:MAG: hypothetical protein AAGA08_13910 [Pseudomonadota bacterium]